MSNEDNDQDICPPSDSYTSINALIPGLTSVKGFLSDIKNGKNPQIFQEGNIGDDTGSIKVVIFNDHRIDPLQNSEYCYLKKVYAHDYFGILQLESGQGTEVVYDKDPPFVIINKTDPFRQKAKIPVCLINEINHCDKKIFETIVPESQNRDTKNQKILNLKKCVSELGYKFSGKLPVPYQDQKMQDAYMLRYFPYYIETIYYILKNLDVSCTSKIFEDNFKVSLYGCGPAPELLGLCGYLRDYQPSTRIVSVSFFDENSWDPWRSDTVNELTPLFWHGIIESQFYKLNLFTTKEAATKMIESKVGESRIHSLQNVVSDLFYRCKEKFPKDDYSTTTEKIADTITDLIGLSSQGSLWIISDQDLPEVQKILQSIADKVKSNKMGEIIMPPDQRHLYSPEIFKLEFVKEFRKNKEEVGFWSMVIRKIYSDRSK